jgi:hypothetical protein
MMKITTCDDEELIIEPRDDEDCDGDDSDLIYLLRLIEQEEEAKDD